MVIDFHADGSGMPQLAAQHFSTLEETWSRIGVDFYRVNVDELDEVAMEIDIRVVSIANATCVSRRHLTVTCIRRFPPALCSRTERRLDMQEVWTQGTFMSVVLY